MGVQRYLVGPYRHSSSYNIRFEWHGLITKLEGHVRHLCSVMGAYVLNGPQGIVGEGHCLISNAHFLKLRITRGLMTVQ